MADGADVMSRLLAAISDLARIDGDRAAAMERRNELLREAQASGETYLTLQRATGLSPVTIAKALRR